MGKKKRNQKKAEAGRERAQQSRAPAKPGRILRDGVLLSKSQTTKRLKQEAADRAVRDPAPWVSPGRRVALADATPEVAAEESTTKESADSVTEAQEETLTEEPVAEPVAETAEKTETIAERLKRIRTST